MRTPQVILELTPTRLSAAPLAGRAQRTRSVTLDPAQWEAAWREGLVALDEPLRALLADLGHAGARVFILYQSPTATVDLVSAPVAGRAGLDAARLAIADAVAFPIEQGTIESAVIARDSVGAPPLTHTLACADRDDNLEALFAWGERAGARVCAAAPDDAPVLRQVVRQIMEGDADAPTARLFIGEHASTIGVGLRGHLFFARTIEVGLASMCDPVARLFTAHENPRAAAMALLASAGLPIHGEELDAELGVSVEDVLPVIQPVLQRLFVELKQSIRFGMSREDAARASLVLHGPGAAVPRLCEVICEQIGLRPAASQPEARPCERIETATIAHLDDPVPPMSLVPRARRARRVLRAAKRGLVGAGVAACLFLLAETGLHLQSAGADEAQLRSMKPALQQAQRLSTTHDSLGAMRAAIDAARVRTDDRLRVRPDWGAWMRELAAATPDTVRLTSVSADTRDAAAVALLRGHASAGADTDATGAIGRFVAALEACPLVQRVELGSAQRIRTPLGDAQRFELTVTLVPVPTPTWDNAPPAPKGAGR